jgi:hypothetical protein
MALKLRAKRPTASTRLTGAFVAIAALLLQPFGSLPIASAEPAIEQNTVCDNGCEWTTITAAVNGEAAGSTITVKADSPKPINSTVLINKQLTINGQSGATITTNAAAEVFTITGSGVVINGLTFQKTNKADQNLVGIQGANVTVSNNVFSGQYVLGEGEVVRAMVVSATSGVNITGNSISGMRQPAYINNGASGSVTNNYVGGTRGWVVEKASEFAFSGNTWGTNALDIAIIPGVDPASTPNNYTCRLAQMKSDNNNATIQDQYPASYCAITPGAQADYTVRGSTTGTENDAKKWFFNRDPNTVTPYNFTSAQASTGQGSLYVPAIGSTPSNKFVGEYFAANKLDDTGAISFDYRLGDGVDASKANQVYMNLYVNYSSTTNYGDCVYNVVANVGTAGWHTLSFDPNTAYDVRTRSSAPSTCPSKPSDLPSTAYLRMVALNVGDTSASDSGVSAYLDNVRVATVAETSVYDFEPADVVAPTVTDLKVTNNALWGEGYNLLTIDNHKSTATGLPTVGGTVQVGAYFDDDKKLTNIISYLPGRGFFDQNEYTPTVQDNNTWTGVQPGRYSVTWDTKNGADWRSVPDGNYNFTFNARDGGNGPNGAQNNTYKEVALTVDNTLPSATFNGSTPDEGADVRGTITVSGDFTDANGLMNTDIGVHTDGRSGQGWKCHTDWPNVGMQTCLVDTTQLPDGEHRLTMAARDKAGNVQQVFRTINVDNTAPAVPTLQSPSNDASINTNDFYFDWNDVSDATRYEIQYSQNPAVGADGSFQNVQWTGDYTQTQPTDSRARSVGANGTWYWQVRSIDALGNTSAWTEPWKVTIDMQAPTAPTLNVSESDGTELESSDFTNSYGVIANWNQPTSDTVKYVYRYWNAIPGNPYKESTPYTVEVSGTSQSGVFNQGEGTHYLQIVAVDAAGNQSPGSNVFEIRYDATGPVVNAGEDQDVEGLSAVLSGETGESVEEMIWEQTSGPGTATFTPVPDGSDVRVDVDIEGEYVFRLTARDAAGNESQDTVTITFAQEDDGEPVDNGGSDNGTGTNGSSSNGTTTNPLTVNPLTVAATPAAPSFASAFIGAANQGTSSEAAEQADSGDVLGTSATENDDDGEVAGASDQSGWWIEDMAWYWWVLAVLGLMGLWLLIAAAIRRYRGSEA